MVSLGKMSLDGQNYGVMNLFFCVCTHLFIAIYF